MVNLEDSDIYVVKKKVYLNIYCYYRYKSLRNVIIWKLCCIN